MINYSSIPKNSLNVKASNNHINNYSYNVRELDGNYIDMYKESQKYQDGIEQRRSALSICSGNGDSNYDVMRDVNMLDDVGQLFFSKKNIIELQKKIKAKVFIETKGKIILDDDQDDSDLLIVMRAVYYQEGRFLPNNVMSIEFQVKKLNIKVINYLYPDLMTNIKQEYYYVKEINEPIKPIDRPINVSIKGRKTNTLFVY